MDVDHVVAVAVLLPFAAGSLIKLGIVSEKADAVQVISNNVTGQEGYIHWFQEKHGTVFQKTAQLSTIRKDNLDIIIMAPDQEKGKSMEVICPGAVNEELCLDFHRYDLSSCRAHLLEPHLPDQLHSTIHIISTLQWSSTTIFSDKKHRSDSQRLSNELFGLGVESELVFVKKDGSNLVFLEQILNTIGMDRAKHRLRFVLMCSLPHVKQILREAEQWDKTFGQGSLLRHFSQWLLLLSRSSLEVIEDMDLTLDHLAVMSRPYPYYDSRELSQMVLDAMAEVLSLEHTYNNSHTRDAFLQIFGSEHTMNTLLYTLLWKHNGRKLSRVKRSWYDASLNDVFPNLKLGLNERELRAATLEFLPFVKRNEINGNLIFTHASIDLVDHLKSVLNFTCSFTEPEDGEWGLPVCGDLSNFTGVMGMLQRGEADLIAAPMGYSRERDHIADFLPSVHESYNGMIFRDTRASSKLSSALTDPFRWQVYAVGGATLLGVILLYFAIEWNNPFYQEATSVEKQLKPASAIDAIMYLLGSAIHQGGVHLPESCSGRILISFWWMFIIVITSAYSGNLIASLTVTRNTPPFTTFDEVFEEANLKIGLLGGGVLRGALETSNDSQLLKLREKIEASSEIDSGIYNPSFSAQMKKVMTENYAFLNDVTELEMFVTTSCNVYILKEKFLPMHYSLLLPQDSPLTDMFSKEVTRVQEMGLMKYWLKKSKPTQKDSACPSIEKGAKPVGLEKLAAALLALGTGALCSGVCLLFEVILKASTQLL
ncbi:glutamate receptor ionotropic, kainate glr-3-like [Haliotis asinina]|uniref:glutamate receptor ionotropic, kainate glr-3-like n=1 Tax=Haliotis asinina TaxID=109174 RepID=UPI003531E212